MVNQNLFFITIIIFSTFSLFSQEKVSLEISPNPVGINDNFNLIIDINHPVTSDIELPKQKYPEGIQLWRGPYIRPATAKTKDGLSKRITRITYTFRARRTGRIVFEPFSVSVNDEVYSTQPFIMEVGNYINRKLVIPLEAEWITPSNFVYTGEAVPLILNIKNQKEIILFDSVSLIPPEGGIFQEFFGIGDISSSMIGEVPLYSIPAAFAIFTPTMDSKITLPSARISSGDSTGESGRYTLNVMPVPEEINSTGAIGRFSVSTRMDQDVLHQKDEAVFRMRIDGTGNLNFLQIPKPEFIGAELLSSYENEKFLPSVNGYKGYREAVYTIKIGGIEDLYVQIPPFPYIERPSGKFIPAGQKTISFSVLPSLPEDEEVMDNEELLPPLLTSRTDLHHILDFTIHPHLLFLFIPGPAAYLIFLLFVGKGSKPGKSGKGSAFSLLILLAFPIFFSLSSPETEKEDTSTEWDLCLEYYYDSNFSDALVELNRIAENSDKEGYISYNRGLILAGLENWDDAVYQIATAVEREPQNRIFREGYIKVITAGNITSSYPLPLPFDVRYIMIIMILLVNLLSIIALLYRLKSGGVLSILMILSSSLILVFMVLFVFSFISASIDRGIIICGSSSQITEGIDQTLRYLKRIPRDVGEDWLPVREGMVLRIRDRAGDYLLVEDGENIRGWLHVDGIRPLGEE